MKRVYLLLTMAALFGSCSGSGGNGNTGVEADSAASDSCHTITEKTMEPAVAKSVRKHEADYFFVVFDSDHEDFINFGNSIDMLQNHPVKGGVAPAISPDGKSIAYTEVDLEYRTVHILDLETATDRTLDFGDHDVYSRSYSPDGNFLTLNYCNDNSEWKVAIYNLANDTYTFPQNQKQGEFHAPTFSPDGKYLVFHDMQKVYIMSFNNGTTELYRTVNCQDMCQQNDLAVNADCKFQLAGDHKHLVFNCADYSADRRDVNRLMYYDIETGGVVQLLAEDYSAIDFHISDDGNIYYLQGFPNYQTKVYMISLSDLKSTRISQKEFGKFSSLSVAY